MHEMQLVENVVDIVLEQAKLADAKKVLYVKLKIGELRDIVDELMEKCFQFLARGTMAEESVLEIEKVPFVVKCSKCGKEKHAMIHDYATMSCDDCGCKSLELVSGREFLIEDMEII